MLNTLNAEKSKMPRYKKIGIQHVVSVKRHLLIFDNKQQTTYVPSDVNHYLT